MREIKITPAIESLLTAIKAHEAPKGYGQVYSGADKESRLADVSKMTVDGALLFQAQMLRKGSKSTAIGGYQFLRKTLRELKAIMGLKGTERFDKDLQDRMAIVLMQRRGLGDYLDGAISRETFANNLAMEWASLPVVDGPKKGKSFYHGDGLNKSFHKPETILALVDAVRAQNKPAQPVSPSPAAVAAQEVKPPPEVKSEAPTRLGWVEWAKRIFA